VAPSPDAAQAIGPAVMVIFIVFGGKSHTRALVLTDVGRSGGNRGGGRGVSPLKVRPACRP